MRKLLIVDDEASVVDGLSATFPWETVEIDTVYKAYSGEQALDILKRSSIDIVITDVKMPGMSGIELMQRARALFDRIKFIILSGYADFHLAQKAIEIQADAYLLKPISDEKLKEEILKVNEKIETEWEEIVSFQRSTQTLRANLPLLRGNLLNDLLQGRRIAPDALEEKLKMLELPFMQGRLVTMITVRMEDKFTEYDANGTALMEYAICNIAEEIYGDYFHVWHCKDAHDYLVFLLKLMDDKKQHIKKEPDYKALRQRLVENKTAQFQNSVRMYLKGTISLMINTWGNFPDQLVPMYQASLSEIRKKFAWGQQLLHNLEEGEKIVEVGPLQRLYEPPTLLQLLEAGRWDAVESKLGDVFQELEARWADSPEHLLEIFFQIISAFSHIAHKNGSLLSDLIGDDYRKIERIEEFRSVPKLQKWSMRVLKTLQEDMDQRDKNSRTTLIEQVHRFMENSLSEDVSLQAIAEHVYLHPVYLSKIYKKETGENLSDYLYRLRMERAAWQLRNSDEKIYEISRSLGYQNTPYFIKVFKKHYGMTPQEYRDGVSAT